MNCLHHRSRRIHQIVDDNHIFVSYISYQINSFPRSSIAQTTLLYESDRQSYRCCKVSSSFSKSQIRRNHNSIQFLLPEIISQYMKGSQRIAGYFEKPLNLWTVQVNGHPTIGTSRFDQVCQEPGRYRYTRLILFVTLSISHIWQHYRNPSCWISLQTINGNQHLHDVCMHWPVVTLNQVNILPAHAAMQPNKKILVGKFDDVPAAQRNIDIVSNFLGQDRASWSSKQLYVTIHSNSTTISLMLTTTQWSLFIDYSVQTTDPQHYKDPIHDVRLPSRDDRAILQEWHR